MLEKVSSNSIINDNNLEDLDLINTQSITKIEQDVHKYWSTPNLETRTIYRIIYRLHSENY